MEQVMPVLKALKDLKVNKDRKVNKATPRLKLNLSKDLKEM